MKIPKILIFYTRDVNGYVKFMSGSSVLTWTDLKKTSVVSSESKKHCPLWRMLLFRSMVSSPGPQEPQLCVSHQWGGKLALSWDPDPRKRQNSHQLDLYQVSVEPGEGF